ncbi:hypothetical protein [Streptomyces sp. NBC_01304]|uniref:hypothetical protein n=1 Tax=Streptomyces sp. NBC_01304 TaxID=2903818 RepID=UPI002E0D1C05|nr:hypothetical protein OG430_48825 [Streptomyces sp. NBC_01304]
MALNPGPGHRRIPCPLCANGIIRMASGGGTLQCSNLKWKHSGFSGGHCTFTTRDRNSIPLKPGERLVIRDFSPFAFARPAD